MGDDDSDNFASIGSMYTDWAGRTHIRDPYIRGGETGISIGGSSDGGGDGVIRFSGPSSVNVVGGSIRGADVGVEVRESGQGVFRGMNVGGNSVADFAYHKDSEVQVINTYAERLFELTSGSFSTVDNDLNFIAQQLLTANDPEEMVNWAQKLKYQYEKVPDFMQSGVKWDLAKEIVKWVAGSYTLDSITSGI